MALDLAAELAAANTNLRRITQEALSELTEELANETNPYTREFLTGQIEVVRNMAAEIPDD